MLDFCKRFVRDESGQDMAEYGLLLVLIAVVVVTAVVAFRDQIVAAFGRATTELSGAS